MMTSIATIIFLQSEIHYETQQYFQETPPSYG